MRRSIVCLIVVASTLPFLNTPASGHPDDPKVLDRMAPYPGPGFREDIDGPMQGVARGGLFATSGVILRSWLTLADFGTGATDADDCWGYTAPSGREFAIIGLHNAISFVEVTNPGNAQIVETIPVVNSLWHDVKIYQNYAYTVSEGGSGIQVFDLTNIDNDTASPRVSLINTVTTGGVTSSHNVAINEDSGYLYRCGGSSGLGLRMYNLVDPTSPVWEATWADRYVHDAVIVSYTQGTYAGKEIAFCCSGFGNGSIETGLDIIDVTDKQNLINLSRSFYPGGAYSHQAWLSADRHYLYLNDELDEPSVPTTTHVIDVSDLANPFAVTSFTNGNTSIGHNLYFRDGFIYEANYRSGLRIFNGFDPLHPTEVGFIDTFPTDDAANFNGAWSVYPYFPSGTVIISDIERGLFVVDVSEAITTINFAFPNGRPTFVDPAGGETIRVEISGTGAAVPQPGTGQFLYDIGAGVVSVPMTEVTPNVYDAVLPAAACGQLINYYFSVETAGAVSFFSPPDAPISVYSAAAGYGSTTLLSNNFEINTGWTTEILGATSGQWQRGVPIDDPNWQYDPSTDSDGSGQCWLTENLNNPSYANPSNTDVDDGAVRLTSPVFDLTTANISVAYDYYLMLTDASGIDIMLVEIDPNGGAGPWSEIARHIGSTGLVWQHNEISAASIEASGVTLTDTMAIRFTVNDGAPQSIVEAGLDAFAIIGIDCMAPCTGADGDINASGFVNGEDIAFFVSAIMSVPTLSEACHGDFDGSGTLDTADIPNFVVALLTQ